MSIFFKSVRNETERERESKYSVSKKLQTTIIVAQGFGEAIFLCMCVRALCCVVNES